jgi:hypothetical protein
MMGQWEIMPVSFNVELEVVRDSDGEVMHKYEFSYDIWDGWTQDPKTVLIGQPPNPVD